MKIGAAYRLLGIRLWTPFSLDVDDPSPQPNAGDVDVIFFRDGDDTCGDGVGLGKFCIILHLVYPDNLEEPPRYVSLRATADDFHALGRFLSTTVSDDDGWDWFSPDRPDNPADIPVV
jgi:hypothetical protein